jgi:hypothetical protein
MRIPDSELDTIKAYQATVRADPQVSVAILRKSANPIGGQAIFLAPGPVCVRRGLRRKRRTCRQRDGDGYKNRRPPMTPDARRVRPERSCNALSVRIAMIPSHITSHVTDRGRASAYLSPRKSSPGYDGRGLTKFRYLHVPDSRYGRSGYFPVCSCDSDHWRLSALNAAGVRAFSPGCRVRL